MKNKQLYPLELTIQEKKYKFTPFDSLTTRQYGVIRKVFAESLRSLSDGSVDNVVNVIKQSDDSVMQMLAAIYIEADEHYFKMDTYLERVELFLDLPQNTFEFKEALLTSFFDGKEKSILADSQIFLQIISKINQG